MNKECAEKERTMSCNDQPKMTAKVSPKVPHKYKNTAPKNVPTCPTGLPKVSHRDSNNHPEVAQSDS